MKYVALPLAAFAWLSCTAQAFADIPALWSALENTPTVWQAGTGLDYSIGKYGAATDTTVLSVPAELHVQVDKLRLDLSVPYVSIRGPGTVVDGIVIGGSGPITTRSGVGAVTTGASWLLHEDSNSFPAVEVSGLVKLPTASTDIGTGKFDYTLSANVYHSFSPSVMLFGTVGYQWLTDFKTYKLKD